jgi:hypothetical protein
VALHSLEPSVTCGHTVELAGEVGAPSAYAAKRRDLIVRPRREAMDGGHQITTKSLDAL